MCVCVVFERVESVYSFEMGVTQERKEGGVVRKERIV